MSPESAADRELDRRCHAGERGALGGGGDGLFEEAGERGESDDDGHARQGEAGRRPGLGVSGVDVLAHHGTSQPGSRPVRTSASRSRPTTVAAQSSLSARRRAAVTAESGGSAGEGKRGSGRSWRCVPFAEDPSGRGRGRPGDGRATRARRTQGVSVGRPAGISDRTRRRRGSGARARTARGRSAYPDEHRRRERRHGAGSGARLHRGRSGARNQRCSHEPGGPENVRTVRAARDRGPAQVVSASPRARSTRRSTGRNTRSSMPMPTIRIRKMAAITDGMSLKSLPSLR